MAAIIRSANLRGVTISSGAPVGPILSWWNFEENGTGNTFANANGGASFFSEQDTSVVTAAGGKDGRKLSLVGIRDEIATPNNLVYITSADTNISDIISTTSLSMGGWISLDFISGSVDAISAFNNSTLVGGSGYADGTYVGVPLNADSSSSILGVATIVVFGGVVTLVTLDSGSTSTGTGYFVGQELSATLPGGSGFTIEVQSISSANVGTVALDFGIASFIVDVQDETLISEFYYATVAGTDAGFADTTPEPITVGAALALWTTTFNHTSGDLSLYINGVLKQTTTVTDWTGPFVDLTTVYNPSIGAYVTDDVFSGTSSATVSADSVFFIKDLAVSAADVTYLYNSGAGRTMAAFKAHLGL